MSMISMAVSTGTSSSGNTVNISGGESSGNINKDGQRGNMNVPPRDLREPK